MNMHENLNISEGKEMVKAILDKMRLRYSLSDSVIINQILSLFKGRLSINFKSICKFDLKMQIKCKLNYLHILPSKIGPYLY